MRYPGERTLSSMLRQVGRDEVMSALRRQAPQIVYGGLLRYASGRRKADGQPWNAPGWSKHAFQEIFLRLPHAQERRADPKTTPEFLIDLITLWVTGRKLPPRPRLPLFESKEDLK